MAREAAGVLRETAAHIEVQWDIENFLNLPHEIYEYVESPIFFLSDTSFVLCIYPKGDKRERSRGFISLFLCKKSGNGELGISFNLAIKAGNTKIKDELLAVTLSDQSISQGKPQFIERLVLSKYMASSFVSTLTVFCSVRLVEVRHKAAPQSTQPKGIVMLSKNLEELLNGNQTDVKLVVQERDFYAHKLILAARCPTFSAMFDNDMAEKNSGIVVISDLDPEYFNDFLLFIYSGKLDYVTHQNAMALYKAAEKYLLDDLKVQCALQMSVGLSLNTILDVLILAEVHEEERLQEKAAEYFVKNAAKIFDKDEWRKFHDENHILAKKLLIKLADTSKAGNSNGSCSSVTRTP